MARHGKFDEREELQRRVRKLLREHARKLPQGGASASMKELCRQDLERWRRTR